MAARTGKAKIAGVMGWPVAHSLSPILHEFWLKKYNIDGAYIPLAVAPENLEQALRSLGLMGFRGCNVTVPHKEKAFLLVDRVDEFAASIGAVNTIVVEADGTLSGSNTDAYGFMENIRQSAPELQVKKALVIGAGGAARAVVAGLASAGLKHLQILNRTYEKAFDLSEKLQKIFPNILIDIIKWEDELPLPLGEGWGEGSRQAKKDFVFGGIPHPPLSQGEREFAPDLIVNTTSLGMKGQPPLELNLQNLPLNCFVTDIVYNPLETPLLTQAKKAGLPTIDGLGMLLHQAVPGFAAWFGQTPEVTPELREKVLEALQCSS